VEYRRLRIVRHIVIHTAAELGDTRVLDNPVWAALTGPQAGLAQGEGRARRFPADLSPLAALPDDADGDAWRDMARLVGPGGVFLGAEVPLPPPPGWTVELELPGVQLVAGAAGPPVAATPPVGDVVRLGAADVPEILDLVARTEPGPFAPRTTELGGYVGVRLDGALVAMAGQRLRPPGWTEVSAVCTSPDVRGRGLAGWLTQIVTAEIRARGDRPFLHALASNTGAVRLYRALGFTLRREVTFSALRAPTS
jgi:GNAT superfamily N-acetyltransferase